MCEEVSKRCGMMRSESRSLSANILKAESIALQQKVLVMQAYILTKGTFQCGAWPALPDVQYKRFHKCILDIYRDACGCKNFPAEGDDSIDVAALFSDDDIMYKHGIINPRTIRRLAELSLFSRIIAKNPPVLLEMIVAQRNFSKGWWWCHPLLQDLAWLLPFLQIRGAPPSCLGGWVGLIGASPRDFMKVKKYCKSPFANI